MAKEKIEPRLGTEQKSISEPSPAGFALQPCQPSAALPVQLDSSSTKIIRKDDTGIWKVPEPMPAWYTGSVPTQPPQPPPPPPPPQQKLEVFHAEAQGEWLYNGAFCIEAPALHAFGRRDCSESGIASAGGCFESAPGS